VNIKKLTLVLISFLFLLEVLPANSAGRGRLRITEVSPASQITLNETETTLTFTVEGMILPPGILAMIMTAGGIPVEVKLIPNNPSLDLSGFTLEPSSGLITFDRENREFGTFQTKIKLNSQGS